MSDITTMPLAELVEDTSVYPRHTVDGSHVGALVDALRAGATLPPIIADRASKRIADGFHRYRAYREVLGDNSSVDVELREYASEADLLLDAIALNSCHGRRLDRMDQVRAIRLAEKAGATIPQISLVLHVPELKIEKMRVRIAFAPAVSERTIPGTREIVLKRPAYHMAGKTLTAAQEDAVVSSVGTSLALAAMQLRKCLDSRLANANDPRLVAELQALFPVLEEWLSELQKEAA